MDEGRLKAKAGGGNTKLEIWILPPHVTPCMTQMKVRAFQVLSSHHFPCLSLPAPDVTGVPVLPTVTPLASISLVAFCPCPAWTPPQNSNSLNSLQLSPDWVHLPNCLSDEHFSVYLSPNDLQKKKKRVNHRRTSSVLQTKELGSLGVRGGGQLFVSDFG